MAIGLAYLGGISWLAILLLVGVVISIISSKLRIPSILLLILVGIISANYLQLPLDFLTSLSLFALIMIIFDSTSKFKLKEVSEYFPYAIKLVGVFFLFNIIFLTLATYLLFYWKGWHFSWGSFILPLAFAGIMSGTAPDVILSIFGKRKNQLIELLEFESLLNSPLVIIFPLMMVEIYQGFFEPGFLIKTFLQSIMTGIGTGLFFGLILSRFMRINYFKNLSALLLIAVTLITYTLAEQLGGNGVLSVMTFGLIYGRSMIKEKEELNKFTSIFTDFLRIIAFILLGLTIRFTFDINFFYKSILLFIIYLIIRYFAVTASFLGANLTKREKLFLTFNTTKGMTVAIIIFILSSFVIEGINSILTLGVLFILYSISVSTITNGFSKFFLKSAHTIEDKKKK